MRELLTFWHLSIPALIITIILLGFHYWSNGYRFTKKSTNYLSGVVLFILMTMSPIDYLGHSYLFSVHMIQHIAILLIIPPLLLTGTDSKYLEKLIKRPGFKKVGKILFLPLVAWMLGVGSMWVWHIPGLYVAMKESMPLMTLNIITMLVFGIIFIWPVFAPVRFMKLDALQTALFLFTACVGCTVLGIYITFMPDSLYTSVLTGHNEIIMSLVKNSWGISPVIDQQMGGLIMWVPACFIYVTNILIGLSKWFRAPETENTNEKSLGVDIK